MAKNKIDGLIEAVHYSADGKIDWVRVYERRGSTFSDIILLKRAELVDRLKKGQNIVTGMRKEFMGSTFETGKTVSLAGQAEIITTGQHADRDQIEDVPLI